MTNEQAKQEIMKGGVQTLSVFDYMKQKKDLINSALPAHLTADRLVSMFTIVLQGNPELLNCSQASLIGAMVQTAQLGLMPGNIAHCYYVPFNNKKKSIINGKEEWRTVREVQFILGYRGMIELVNRSKNAAILSAECVYQNDEFSYAFGLNPYLNHRPADGDRGVMIGVYAIAKNMMANEKVFVYLTKEEIEKVQAASKAGQSEYSPWVRWQAEMWKKTAIKRLYKLLPLSVDIQKNLSADETIKTEIAQDMSAVKDDTNWDIQEAQVKEEVKQEELKVKAEMLNDADLPFLQQQIEDKIRKLDTKRQALFFTKLEQEYKVPEIGLLNKEQAMEILNKLPKE